MSSSIFISYIKPSTPRLQHTCISFIMFYNIINFFIHDFFVFISLLIIYFFLIFYMDQKIITFPNNSIYTTLPTNNSQIQSQKPCLTQIQLIQQSIFNQQIRQEIQLQKVTSKKISKELMTHLTDLEKQATILASKLQNQIEKNNHLNQLVGLVQQRIEQQKLDNSQRSNQINNIQKSSNDDVLSCLQKKLKKTEYDLQQLIQKLNESQCQIRKTMEIVNSARSQRVVYSGVFKNIEKQLFDAQIEYKKLLIQKLSCENKLKYFYSLHQKLVQQNTKVCQLPNIVFDAGLLILQQSMTNKPQSVGTTFITNRGIGIGSDEQSTIKLKSSNSEFYNKKQVVEQQKMNNSRQNIIKTILMQCESSSPRDLVNNLNNIQNEIQQNLTILKDFDDKISEYENKLNIVKKNKRKAEVLKHDQNNSHHMKINKLKLKSKKLDHIINQQNQNMLRYISSFYQQIQKNTSTELSYTHHQNQQFPDYKIQAIQITKFIQTKFISQQSSNNSQYIPYLKPNTPKKTIYNGYKKQQSGRLNQLINKNEKSGDPMKLLSQNDMIAQCQHQIRKKHPTIKMFF